MRLPKRITAKWLERRGACPNGVEDFREVFGESCAFTVANVRRARERMPDRAVWLAEAFSPKTVFTTCTSCAVCDEVGAVHVWPWLESKARAATRARRKAKVPA
jgi:hypothetical protein